MKKLIIWVILISSLTLFGSCDKKEDGWVEDIYVASRKPALESEAGSQAHYFVRSSNEGAWRLFYNEIVGFNYVEGYEYVLQVKVRKSDGSNLSYTLLSILSKVQKQSEGLPS